MARSDLPNGAALLVLFDGRCGICTRWALWLTARDRRGQIVALPNQTPGVLRRYGATQRDVDQAVWLIDRGGEVYRGAAAVNRALLELPRPWRWLATPYALSLMARAEDVVYRWVAVHRQWLARWGVAPACARPGAVCESIDIS